MNFMEDCFAGTAQNFLICITVHKAAEIGVANGELYVKMSFGKMSKHTKSFSNSANPYFNEYFVFELVCTLAELLRLTILFQLKKYVLCKKDIVIGEMLIDLHSVWNQPNHSFYKKWGRLEAPLHESAVYMESDNNRGHLQIDLAIISQHSALRPNQETIQHINKWSLQRDFDDIESNLLQNPNSSLMGNIRYFISIYRGYFIKKSNYMIQVSFAGFNAKSQVAKNTTTPVWNHEISFAWTYPSFSQRFLILILSHEHLQWKCVAEYELLFDEIAFKNKPALGPTYLHFYDPVNSINYVGRLLIELRTEPIQEQHPSHLVVTQSVPNLDESRFWNDDIYQVEFLPLQGDNIRTSGLYYKITVKMAEHTSNTIEGHLKTPSGKFHTAVNTKYFRQDTPYHSCMFRIRMPDNRTKFESDFFIIEIINYMISELNIFNIFQLKYPHQYDNQVKLLKIIISNIIHQIKEGVKENRIKDKNSIHNTTWDINRQLFLLEYFEKMPYEMITLQNKLKSTYLNHLDASITSVVNDLKCVIDNLNSLINILRVQDDWPEVILLLHAGGKEIGACKLNAKQFLDLSQWNSSSSKQATSNNNCWHVQSFIFKSTSCYHTCMHCGCSSAVILGCMGIVVERERKEFLAHIANDWVTSQPMTWLSNLSYTYFRCQVYVHQAKVRPGGDKKSLCDGYLRVFFNDKGAETYTALATLSPIWNTVIKFNSVLLPGSINWYQKSPPLLSLEFYDANKLSADSLIGTGHISVSVIAVNWLTDGSKDDAGNKLNKTAFKNLQRLKYATPPPLKWVPISKQGMLQAEVLMSAEFIEILGDPNMHSDNFEATISTGIPSAIRPNMLNYVLEVIFVGLRNYAKHTLTFAGKRRIRVMMADLVLTSGLSTSRMRNSINFLFSYAAGIVSLPDQQEYWPAMIATDVAITYNNNESLLGAALIPNLTSFLQREQKAMYTHKDDIIDKKAETKSSIVPIDSENEGSEMPEEIPPCQKKSCWIRFKSVMGLHTGTYVNRKSLIYDHIDSTDLFSEAQYTWWTKFYNSIYADSMTNSNSYKHRLVIYPNELEQQAHFSYLQDWAVPVQLVHRVKSRKNKPPKEDIYATLKLQLQLTPSKYVNDDEGGGDMLHPLIKPKNPQQQAIMQALSDVVQLTVRIYIVQGLQMRPRDIRSASDCYVRLFLGEKTMSDRAHYVPNQTNPIFGRFFEMEAMLPSDHILQILVYDMDNMSDDIIGSTTIDIEDRWRSKHRATVGIANEFTVSGYNMWHDVQLPSEILSDLCQQHRIQPPHFYSNVIKVDGMLFADDTAYSKTEELHERLSLIVLKNLDKLPSFGYKLVPEHVETRSLYRDEYPGIEQGKLQLWIELYEANMYIPQPIDVTPTPPISYEVRVVVKNLSTMQAGDKNIFGKLMSDLFVRGWCQDAHKHQSTDIHYRSFAGDAAFNWRMIFPLKYSPNEDMMVIRHKSGLHEEIEIKRPPIIYLQVWDKDVLTSNDYLGAIELTLSNLILPYPTAGQCQPDNGKRKRINLFKNKTIKGWFPLLSPFKPPHGLPKTSLGGKIELEMHICTETEASNSPAGLGREPPMALEMPYRPKSTFNPMTHPLKSVRHILWPAIRKYVFILLLLLVIGSVVIIFFTTLPNKILSFPFI